MSKDANGHNGNDDNDRDGDLPMGSDDLGRSDGSSSCFQLLEESQAFLEATCGSRMEYKTRVAQATKCDMPDSKWTTCPELSVAVAATLSLSKDTIKEDKMAFRTQEIYMEALVPLTALLENTGEEDFSLKETIPMV